MDFNVSRLTSLLTRHSTSAPSGRVSYALVIFLSFAPAAQCRSSVCYAGYRPVKPFLVENFRPRPETPGHAERASLTHERSRCERQVPPGDRASRRKREYSRKFLNETYRSARGATGQGERAENTTFVAPRAKYSRSRLTGLRRGV